LALALSILCSCGATAAAPPPPTPMTPEPEPVASTPEPQAEPEPEPVVSAPPEPVALPAHELAGLSAEASEILDEHNRARRLHCAPPLKWSKEVAAVAQRWANKLRAAHCAFDHSNGKYGENLAAGTSPL